MTLKPSVRFKPFFLDFMNRKEHKIEKVVDDETNRG
jgi:hypothetical protein